MFSITVNLSKKVRAARMGPDFTEDDIEKVLLMIFTRRIALQVVAQLYDPMGHVTPYTIKFKIGMKNVVNLGLTWDEALPESYQQIWRDWLVEMIRSKPVFFPRSIAVEEAESRPEIIGFFDGSDLAFCAVVYLRWVLPDGAT